MCLLPVYQLPVFFLSSLPNPFSPFSQFFFMNSSYMNSKSQNHLCCLPLLQTGSLQVVPGGVLLSVFFFFFPPICWKFHRFPSLILLQQEKPFHLSRECRLRQLKPVANCAIIKLETDYPFSPLPCCLLCAWRLLSFHCQSFSSPNLCIPLNFPPLVTVPRAALPGAQSMHGSSCCLQGFAGLGMLLTHDFHMGQDSAVLEGCRLTFQGFFDLKRPLGVGLGSSKHMDKG